LLNSCLPISYKKAEHKAHQTLISLNFGVKNRGAILGFVKHYHNFLPQRPTRYKLFQCVEHQFSVDFVGAKNVVPDAAIEISQQCRARVLRHL